MIMSTPIVYSSTTRLGITLTPNDGGFPMSQKTARDGWSSSLLNHVVRSLAAPSVPAMMALASQAKAQMQGTRLRFVPEAVSTGRAMLVAQRLQLVISLPLRYQGELHQFPGAICDPTNSQCRKYLSVAEFTERFDPSQADHDAGLARPLPMALSREERPQQNVGPDR